ncbi:mechanosensitive ion channel family protein [Mycobacterium sp. OTB74]|jgi:small-conductance mechanosensitive channel/CRP-like cAMP-binding protein|uniref:mechanosensitive ion channel family protein n=1 Tax=Mycobacterium sp. OTB74 TaxID=1853452 RepID=UPI0024737048|nr:mechanosensitive ion channel family protein [Mycobacterium sp. OTB74]MDH6242879.1 small-conductance mechanosensitive channel/CRP-like cAMP-binding protein [Mycobacterium sp. OTB74]
MSPTGYTWFSWVAAIAIGLPATLIALTELHRALVRRQSPLAKPVMLLRTYLLPLAAVLLVMVKVAVVPADDVPLRIVATALVFVALLLVLSGLSNTVFAAAPEGTWRNRVPRIFIDVARLMLIAVGLAVISRYIWGANIKGVFTAVGVSSVVIGLLLQQSVGQIMSGLFMLFEQPFRMGDWLDTTAARGRVVEVNWRAVHIETSTGLQVTPNSVLAGTSFTNLSRLPGTHTTSVTTTFAASDSPDQVCATLVRAATALPQRKPDVEPTAVAIGANQYRTTIGLKSPADDNAAQAVFLRWIWYAARREKLHLDGAGDEYSTPKRLEQALRAVAAPALRLSHPDQRSLMSYSRLLRYSTGEIVQAPGEVPATIGLVVSGRVRLTVPADDGSPIVVRTLDEGAILGVAAFTHQSNLATAHALDEVTLLQIEHDQIQSLLTERPLLSREFGRLIDERRAEIQEAVKSGPQPDAVDRPTPRPVMSPGLRD